MNQAVFHTFLALAVIMATARLVGAIFSRFQQPPVIGEVIAGILLGPSLLGWLAPAVSAFVLPPFIMPGLNIIAQLGVALFMFVVGLELDVKQLSGHTRSSVAISQASIAVPFILGWLLAWLLYDSWAPKNVPFNVFALFVGISLAVTAFPVLARILTDRRIHRTHIGTIALASAAANDLAAWCLLALVVGLARAQSEPLWKILAMTATFIAVLIVAVRPLLLRFAARCEGSEVSNVTMVAVGCVGMLVSALATEWIGIHALFGAFLFGCLIPHDSRLAHQLHARIGDLVVVLLLPTFFAFAGIRTQIGLLSGGNDWAICGVIIVVASMGKFGGTFIAARWSGLDRRQAASLGVLMNTRGLMEIIVLNVGLDLGVISPTLFAILVLMAVVTTMLTTPLLTLLDMEKTFGLIPAAQPADFAIEEL